MASHSDKEGKHAGRHNKAVQELYAKQEARRLKTGLLPDPSLGLNDDDYTSFVACLKGAKHIVALLGAGLSAPSGVATFRGAGSSWRGMDVMDVASIDTWANDPALVWLFYAWRRSLAMKAVPNRGHAALAALARKCKAEAKAALGGSELLAVNQNIDDLSRRSGHTPDLGLVNIHGSLFDFSCESETCDYIRTTDYTEPLCSALDIAAHEAGGVDLSDPKTPRPVITRADLPHCPKCSVRLLRPNIVWFGEPLDEGDVDRIHDWFDGGAAGPKEVDLMLVVGTSAVVFPAAAYIHAARQAGARVAYFNVDKTWDDESPYANFREDKDWWFRGSAAETLPEVLKEVVGPVRQPLA